jgi:hypothetical protein
MATAAEGIGIAINEMDKKLLTVDDMTRERVCETDLFKVQASTLNDPRVKDNVFFNKLKERLNTFYVVAEKFRMFGPNRQQSDSMQKSGIGFNYRMNLHKCLKKLLLEVISTRDSRHQEVYAKQVFVWFF